MSKEENKVVPKDQTNRNLMASKIQEELLKLTEDLNNSTFLIGSKILDVQRNKLYKEWGYGSFSNWLDKLSQEANVGKTTLWDYRKIVEMLKNTNTPFSEVSNANIKGLYQIARIHKKTNDDGLTKQLLIKLVNEETTDKTLHEFANKITTLIKRTDPSDPSFTSRQVKELTKKMLEPADKIVDTGSDKKSTWEINRYQGFFISLLLVTCIIFYIANAF
tara:strand:+ start:8156 stop:8812 length:657 start_codon:yes stop_codon:yes gene_type:complete